MHVTCWRLHCLQSKLVDSESVGQSICTVPSRGIVLCWEGLQRGAGLTPQNMVVQPRPYKHITILTPLAVEW